MRYIRPYYESFTNLTQEQIDFLDDCTLLDGEWKLNPDTGLIDVLGSFSCKDKGLYNLKDIRFGRVSLYFFCNGNNLKTLDGSPREVGAGFWCQNNPLISLEGAPLKVEEYFLFNKINSHYNLTTFLEEIKKERPGVAEILLTHHFFTPGVIKREITKDSYFCYYVSRAWNTEGFKKKQDELTKILTEKDLQKIEALWSIGGYL